jgi:hypothetical protein
MDKLRYRRPVSRQSVQDLRGRVMRVLFFAALGTVVALFPFIVRAEDQAPAPATIAAQPNGVQDVIKQQLSAIRSRDADGAYALMTHDFHERHEDAKTFLASMRFDNRAIYNHEEYTFLDQQGSGPVSIQKVRVNDHYGTPITVIYRLEQQEDGSWLIDSFMTLDAEAQPI